MSRTWANLALSVIVAVFLAGCAGDSDLRANETEPAASDSADTTQPPSGPADEQDRGSPDAAVAVLKAYYNAIATRDYARAYAMWADSGRASGQTFEEFRSGYARTESVEAEIGAPGRVEGAAGSRYIELPATVRATTTQGEPQCFRGTYTLRRSEVDGATVAQREWRIYTANLQQRPAGECTAMGPGGAAVDSVRNLVESFGRKLAQVSLLAPPDVLQRDMREHYGPSVTPDLLARWLADPADAPGREVSSPWPERIEVLRVQRLAADRYRIIGNVVYVASTTGGQAAVERKRVTIDASRTSAGWRISAWE